MSAGTLRWAAWIWLLGLWIAAPGPAWGADAPLREDRIRFVVHDLVVGQITDLELGNHLSNIHKILHNAQDLSIDAPTCTDFGTVTDGGDPPVLFTTNGALPDALAVIDNEEELLAVLDWANTQGDRVGVFVQDILWCGAPAPNAIGCAPTPGEAFVVALDTPVSLRHIVIAHERGHNAGLSHRTNHACALMFPSAETDHGCLNQNEAGAFHGLADIATGDTCECIDLQSMGPFQTWTANPQGTACDDGDACTTSSSCNAGLCVGNAQLDCSDGDPCTGDFCDSETGCSNPVLPDTFPCPDGDVCNGNESCRDGVCESGTPLVCDDGEFCNGAETCDPTLGCQAGTAPTVDDGVGCTDDSCDESADTVVHDPNDALCDDGEFCNGAETCDPALDCQSGTAPTVDDGVSCTDDSCDESADTVVHDPNDALCDDGQFCNGAETCDPALDCLSGTAPTVDDGVSCTDDSCDESADTVVHDPNDALCDDGQFCNGAETCDPALDCQSGTAPTVDDGVSCTDDSCDESADTIVHDPDPSLCDDGDPCTAESCDALTGCQHDPVPLCGSEVAAAPAWGRAALGALLVAAGSALLRLRARR